MAKVITPSKIFNDITDYWSPVIAGELNGQHIKLAKFKGEFDRHKHENEDEMFFVIKGELTITLDTEKLIVKEGEYIIIPKNTYHKPFAEKECHVMLFEPISTINTGNIISERTRNILTKII
jgi:mannose-6-phosphate isomerase-like protein (cupin superfamily)